jgi:predicted oxidoreductase
MMMMKKKTMIRSKQQTKTMEKDVQRNFNIVAGKRNKNARKAEREASWRAPNVLSIRMLKERKIGAKVRWSGGSLFGVSSPNQRTDLR